MVKIRINLGIGSESKISVDVDLERLKDICCWENGQGKRVPVSRSHRDKQIGECLCSVSTEVPKLFRRGAFFQLKFFHGALR